MALDSAAKRYAVPGVGRPWMRSILNDATSGRAWRSSVGLSYPVANFEGAAAAGGNVGARWKASVARRKKIRRRQ